MSKSALRRLKRKQNTSQPNSQSQLDDECDEDVVEAVEGNNSVISSKSTTFPSSSTTINGDQSTSYESFVSTIGSSPNMTMQSNRVETFSMDDLLIPGFGPSTSETFNFGKFHTNLPAVPTPTPAAATATATAVSTLAPPAPPRITSAAVSSTSTSNSYMESIGNTKNTNGYHVNASVPANDSRTSPDNGKYYKSKTGFSVRL